MWGKIRLSTAVKELLEMRQRINNSAIQRASGPKLIPLSDTAKGNIRPDTGYL